MSPGLPPSWKRMTFTQKAGYLCSVRLARDYSHACSLLAKRQPSRKAGVTVESYQNNLAKRGLD